MSWHLQTLTSDNRVLLNKCETLETETRSQQDKIEVRFWPSHVWASRRRVWGWLDAEHFPSSPVNPPNVHMSGFCVVRS